MKVNEIQEQLGRGEYRVDAHAVADAIVRRMLAERGLRADGSSQPSA